MLYPSQPQPGAQFPKEFDGALNHTDASGPGTGFNFLLKLAIRGNIPPHSPVYTRAGQARPEVSGRLNESEAFGEQHHQGKLEPRRR